MRQSSERAALQAQTQCVTFPQFFVDGAFHGGAADACLKWKKGELQQLFKAAKVEHSEYSGDPFEVRPPPNKLGAFACPRPRPSPLCHCHC